MSKKNAGQKDDKPIKPEVGALVNEKYTVVRQLGEGGFGAVFEVIHKKTDTSYAMKIELEEPASDEPGLDTEGSVLRRLQGRPHILGFVDEGRYNDHRFMVMQLAGNSLSGLRRNQPTKAFTNSTTVRVAVQMLQAIESCHVAGLLHRDIKPANYAMGKEPDHKIVFLLDFGLVRKYIINGKHRPARRAAGFRGSVRYASLNCHNRVDLGRVDDLWSWLYSVIEMRTGKLPWSNEIATKKCGDIKAKTTEAELMEGMEPELTAIYKSLITLKYESTPPYQEFKEQFEKINKRKNYAEDAPLDWEQGGQSYQHTRYMPLKPVEDKGEQAIAEQRSKKDE